MIYKADLLYTNGIRGPEWRTLHGVHADLVGGICRELVLRRVDSPMSSTPLATLRDPTVVRFHSDGVIEWVGYEQQEDGRWTYQRVVLTAVQA